MQTHNEILLQQPAKKKLNAYYPPKSIVTTQAKHNATAHLWHSDSKRMQMLQKKVRVGVFHLPLQNLIPYHWEQNDNSLTTWAIREGA